MHVTPGYDSSIQFFTSTGQARRELVNTDAREGTSDARHLQIGAVKCARGDDRVSVACVGEAILGQASDARKPLRSQR